MDKIIISSSVMDNYLKRIDHRLEQKSNIVLKSDAIYKDDIYCYNDSHIDILSRHLLDIYTDDSDGLQRAYQYILCCNEGDLRAMIGDDITKLVSYDIAIRLRLIMIKIFLMGDWLSIWDDYSYYRFSELVDGHFVYAKVIDDFVKNSNLRLRTDDSDLFKEDK